MYVYVPYVNNIKLKIYNLYVTRIRNTYYYLNTGFKINNLQRNK